MDFKNKIDYHIHSEYSFDVYGVDKQVRIFDICETALKKGLTQIAITDHYDINTVEQGFIMGLDFESRRRDIIRAKKAYEGKLKVLCGIELGQPHQVPEKAKQILKENKFDYVIASYHNNVDVPDFYILDYPNIDRQLLVQYYEDYLCQTIDHIKWGIGRISTLGHLGYPIRYYIRNGLGGILNPYDPKYMKITKEIFNLLIKNDIALEVNTSGWRQGMNNSMAFDGMVQYYIDMGGKLLTVGSDSHTLDNVGDDIDKQYGILYKMGVKNITAFESGKPYFVDIV
ncbi:MAG: histidinol-phosphatase HisJ family protein [Clostridia bacterium]|nr:histidinol-phosphatase HisJ family protein [Clostridia bacterium]